MRTKYLILVAVTVTALMSLGSARLRCHTGRVHRKIQRKIGRRDKNLICVFPPILENV